MYKIFNCGIYVLCPHVFKFVALLRIILSSGNISVNSELSKVQKLKK